MKARTTIEVLTRNMIQADIQMDRIFEYYDEVKRPDVIKMLLRCKLLYEARVEVKKILFLIIKKEETLEKIQKMISEGSSNIKDTEETTKLVFDGMKMVQRLIS